ncbi:GSK3-beta interaction protein-like [Ptychodera flava]|uniref:GSK3-beta interaction protein-like n=1 Tax=Ptychodera flava TaxID=63121 RepID=UPI00396A1B1A
MSDGEEQCRLMAVEAEAAVQEVSFAVKSVEISETLPKKDEVVYLNLLTKEDEKYCVELSLKGFRVVGRSFNENGDTSNNEYFETIYALLDQVSPGYRLSFGEALVDKLAMLQQQTENKEDEELK